MQPVFESAGDCSDAIQAKSVCAETPMLCCSKDNSHACVERQKTESLDRWVIRSSNRETQELLSVGYVIAGNALLLCENYKSLHEKSEASL